MSSFSVGRFNGSSMPPRLNLLEYLIYESVASIRNVCLLEQIHNYMLFQFEHYHQNFPSELHKAVDCIDCTWQIKFVPTSSCILF